MPSSLTRVHSLTLGFSPRPPVSVCGTGTSRLARGFSWQREIRNFGHASSSSQPRVTDAGFASHHSSLLERALPAARFPILLRPPITQMAGRWYRNINLLSIVYAYRPRLRSRLTLSGRAFLRKPWSYGGWDSHPSFATHTGILTSKRSTCPSGQASQPLERSPTTHTLGMHPQLR